MDPNCATPSTPRRKRIPRRNGAYWRTGRRLRWFLHVAILLTIGASLLMPWGRNGGTVAAENQIVADESVWNSALDLGTKTPATTVGTAAVADLTPMAILTPTVAPTAALGATAEPSASASTSTPVASATSTAVPSSPTPSPTATRVTEPRQYQVASGDTVEKIAQRFSISQETLLWANGLTNPNSLSVGQTLVILPVSGMSYQIKAGDSLSSIATQYGVTAAAIQQFNNLSATDILSVGQTLVIPGAKPVPATPTATSAPVATATRVPLTATPRPPTATPAPVAPAAAPKPAAVAAPAAAQSAPAQEPPKGNGQLAWPVAGLVTQQFGENGHSGLDIATSSGTPVRAAADGKVVNLQQTQVDYGWYVVVDHGNGLKTLYAHLSAFNVKLGDTVKRGQQVGAVGTTGRVTGPHLHFEVRSSDKLVNPVNYFP